MVIREKLTPLTFSEHTVQVSCACKNITRGSSSMNERFSILSSTPQMNGRDSSTSPCLQNQTTNKPNYTECIELLLEQPDATLAFKER
jgi:hypothetical protein